VRFWDSSAIVPLLVGQDGSPQADGWLREDDEVVLWTLTPVEVVSALRRLVREGGMDEESAIEAEARAEELVVASHVVVDVEAAKARAKRLLRLHALRAADALQLAAAVEWAAGRPEGRILHTLDDRLAQAARREGFDVNPPAR
jgi:hypothetical protein